MPLRFALFPALLILLAGCTTPTDEAITAAPATVTGPVGQDPQAASLNAISGSLLGVPAGAEVELALLQVGQGRRPERLLANLRLQGDGDELPFLLQFNPDSFAADRPVELRGRVTQRGQLILQLPPRSLASSASQSIGQLRVQP
ncbi:YbaY family lipoprotein [Stutzerimonas tarimensis]|uniref:YbaY family lipoprotein n=1 Tax=Stutzerimonas tarimensis TaxID=1507735 RepID=A0ABV7T197_9GAMM